MTELEELHEALNGANVSMLARENGWSQRLVAAYWVKTIGRLLTHRDVEMAVRTDAFRKAHSHSLANKVPCALHVEILEREMANLIRREDRMRRQDLFAEGLLPEDAEDYDEIKALKHIVSPIEEGAKRSITHAATALIREIEEYQTLYPTWLVRKLKDDQIRRLFS